MSKCKVVVGQLGLGRIFEFHIFGLVLCLSFFRVVFLFLLPYFSSPWSLSSSLLSIMIVLFCSKTSWHCSSFDNYHGIIRIQLLVPERSMGAWILSSRLSKKDRVFTSSLTTSTNHKREYLMLLHRSCPLEVLTWEELQWRHAWIEGCGSFWPKIFFHWN